MVEIDWNHPGGIFSPGCPHHPCLAIPGPRQLPVLSPIKKLGWWNKNGCCHLNCGSDHFDNIEIIVNGSNMTPFSSELDTLSLAIPIDYIFITDFVENSNLSDNIIIFW